MPYTRTNMTRNRETTKRQIMAALSPNTNTKAPSDAASVGAAKRIDTDKWCQRMHDEMEKRINSLRDDCISENNKQQQVFASAMVKLPRNTKNMTVSEFSALYKVDLLQTFLMKQPPNAKEMYSLTASHLQTPATVAPRYQMTKKKNITTPSRAVRRGEVLFSKNGSPVEGVIGGGSHHFSSDGGADGGPRLVATVTKATPGVGPGAIGGASRLLTTSTATSLEIDIGDGELVSLKDPRTGGIRKLAPDQLDSTLLQLQMLKDQVDSAMQQLQN